MAYRRVPFAPDEWYHLYSRGIDKRTIFHEEHDYQRFKKLLYLANSYEPINLETMRRIPFEDIFSFPRSEPIVAIGVYCLMGNHPHIVLQEKVEGGISKFLHKLGTAYSMYYNKKYGRIGNLLVKPFRSQHISNEPYLRRVAQYVHLNPAEIFEHSWKDGVVKDIAALEQKLMKYKHSSLPDYFGKDKRPERAILDDGVYALLKDRLPSLSSVLKDAAAYYAAINRSFEPGVRGRRKGWRKTKRVK